MDIILPDLTIEAKAELLSNNFEAFAKVVREGIAQFDYELLSDDDFDQAAKDVKTLKHAEGKLADAEKAILEGNADIAELTANLAELREEARALRLRREKEIKKAKDDAKDDIIENAWKSIDTLSNHTFKPQFEKELKGMASLPKMEEKATALQAEINDRIARLRTVIETYRTNYGEDVARGQADLELKTSEEVLRAELDKRVAEQRAQKAQWEKEEQQKAFREKQAEEQAKTVTYDNPAVTETKPQTETSRRFPHLFETKTEQGAQQANSPEELGFKPQEPELLTRHDYAKLLLQKLAPMKDWLHANTGNFSNDDIAKIEDFRAELNQAYKNLVS